MGIAIQFTDGRRDIFISRNTEAPTKSGASLLVEKESGVRFDGDLCLIRFNSAKQPERLLFCRGKTLHAGKVIVQAKDEEANFEIDLGNQSAPVISGPTDAVERIEIAGARLGPK